MPRGTVRPPLRQRAASFVLAVVVTLIMVLAMWSLNGGVSERPRFKGTTLLDFKPDADTPDTSSKQAPKPQPRHEAEAAPTRPTPPRPTPPPPPVSPLPVIHPYYIPLTREENDSADISKLPHGSPRVASAQGAGQASTGEGPGDSRRVGNAPDGSPLYKAEWVRRPTNAELDFYLPKNKEIHGVGVVACKTVAGHHVEDCVELGSIPTASHLAGAVRQAAWQFLVRAPRRGGKELVGAWVYIEITYDFTILKKTDQSPEAPAREE